VEFWQNKSHKKNYVMNDLKKFFPLVFVFPLIFIGKFLIKLFNTATSAALDAYHLDYNQKLQVINLAEEIKKESGAFNADEDKIIALINGMPNTSTIKALIAYYLETYKRDIKSDLDSFMDFWEWSDVKQIYRDLLKD
jgi:hypothetical protein